MGCIVSKTENPIGLDGRTAPSIGEKIAIIGAGPSGLHYAHLLRSRGYKNVVIFEKSGRYGGKTVTIPHLTEKDVVHELGTCYMHPAYDAVRDLAEELGCAEEIDEKGLSKARVFTDDPNLERYVRGKGWVEFEEWIYASVEAETLGKEFWLVPDKLSKLTVVKAILRYSKIHQSIFGKYKAGLPPRPNAQKFKEIEMNFADFLSKNKLNALKPLLAYGLTAQGYGVIDQVPAFYGMMWITPAMLKGYATAGTIFGDKPKKSMFKKGFIAIWDAIVENLKKDESFHMRFNTHVKQVTRTPEVVTIKGTDDEGKDFSEQFAYVIVAAPLISCDKYMDLNPTEKGMLSNLENYRFRTTLFMRDPEPDRQAHIDLWLDKLLGPTAGNGEVFAIRDSYVAFHSEVGHTKDQKREQMCYQFIGNLPHQAQLTEEELDEKVKDFVQNTAKIPGYKRLRLGEDTAGSWEYFYHFTNQGLREGGPWRILEQQGRNRTMFVHATACFESVLDIVNYQHMLFDRIVDPLAN